jgi:ABC-type transport system involved in multi-copper enzyme maturation permease subunit
MFFLLGVLGCLVYGMDTMVRRDYLKFISIFTGMRKSFWFTITARLIILFMAYIFLYAISVLPLLVFDGINLFSTSFPVILVIILSFFFFFSIGCLVGLIKSYFTRTLILGAVYFITVILLPWGLGFYSEISAKDMPTLIDYDFKNFNIAMKEDEYLAKKYGLPKANDVQKAEAIKDFKKSMRKIKKTIGENEDSIRKHSLEKIKTQQTIAAFFPTLFYFAACESNGSVGVINCIDFHSYCLEKKDGFSDFIRENSFTEDEKDLPKKVENFIKGDEDLFFAKPKLPYSFLFGVICTLVYSLVILLIAFKRLMKSLINAKPKKNYAIENEEYNPVFSLCGNPGIKADIVNFYRGKERAVVLEKINSRDFNGIKPHELFIHVCRVNGIDEKKARENLSILGIRDLTGLSCDEEIIMKIYAAVRTAVDFDVIVIDEFVNKESREFENDVFRLLMALEKAGKKIVYLSLHMKQQRVRFPDEDTVKVDEYATFPLNFKSNSVR